LQNGNVEFHFSCYRIFAAQFPSSSGHEIA
jgi:hypothetical protein